VAEPSLRTHWQVTGLDGAGDVAGHVWAQGRAAAFEAADRFLELDGVSVALLLPPDEELSCRELWRRRWRRWRGSSL